MPPRSFVAADVDIDELCKAKADAGLSISVCIPARDEELTVGGVVSTIRRDLVERHALVDEILVVDDGSTDRTAAVATEAGAAVISGPAAGKGDALWTSVAMSTGDLVVWCDADVRGFDARFVIGLAAPMLLDEDIDFVKGWYERNSGRVTELTARPVISLLYPHLSAFAQPLSGEYAGRRTLLEELPFTTDYGVDLGLLIDVADRIGLDRIAQVDLGVRVHRNRPLEELTPQAEQVLRAALERADMVPIANRRPPIVDLATSRRRTA
ncbi:MAG TPA: glucosyl-3-phosphoglycerate synthase [Acidimicrobiales bacterium]|nr:glucosyl-3-phosphoglycerate synthase [Acidimicrobiales bacterium]